MQSSADGADSPTTLAVSPGMGAHVDARTVSTTEKVIARLAKIPAARRKRRVIAIKG
jgi:hypothetical protein